MKLTDWKSVIYQLNCAPWQVQCLCFDCQIGCLQQFRESRLIDFGLICHWLAIIIGFVEFFDTMPGSFGLRLQMILLPRQTLLLSIQKLKCSNPVDFSGIIGNKLAQFRLFFVIRCFGWTIFHDIRMTHKIQKKG